VRKRGGGDILLNWHISYIDFSFGIAFHYWKQEVYFGA
jgi:hypothetical protein